MRVYKLRFHSALHVDSRGTGEPETAEEFIRSDTLSAALCLSWSTVFREKGPDFFLNPPFRVSSAFPYIGEILLFPMPVWQIWKKTDVAKRKEFKGIKWLSQGLFEEVLAGRTIGPETFKKLPAGIAVSLPELEKHPELEEIRAWAMSERQRVSVDRLGMPTDGGLFFFALQFFAPHSGLWFAASAKPADESRLRAALNFLGDTGIGADRNIGLGHFQVCGEEAWPQPLKKRDGWVTLSLFNPGPDDDLKKLTRQTAYGLTTRSGWVSGTSVGRPPIRAFTEGSYFSEKPEGRVKEMLSRAVREEFGLRVDHAAPRDFRAVHLPCAEPPGLKGGEQ